MTALGMILVGAGLILMWSAVKGEDPRELIVNTLAPSSSPRPPAQRPYAHGTGGL